MKSETWQGYITFSAKNLSKMTIGNDDTGKGLEQCFPTFFGSRHPYVILQIFDGTPGWIFKYKNQGIATIGGTPGTCLRHPGWESLA